MNAIVQSLFLLAVGGAKAAPLDRVIGFEGAWAIHQAENACFIEQTLNSATTVSIMRFADKTRNPRIFLRNAAWRSLTAGQRVHLDLKWNGTDENGSFEQSGSGNGTVAQLGKEHVIWFSLPADALMSIFTWSNFLTISTEGNNLAIVPARSLDPLMRLDSCARGAADPFAK